MAINKTDFCNEEYSGALRREKSIKELIEGKSIKLGWFLPNYEKSC